MPDTYQVIWSIPALNDLKRLREFIEPKNPDAAARAVARIKHIVRQLQETPKIGTTLSNDDPRLEVYPRFGQNGYMVRYSVNEDTMRIRIIRAWHSREDRAG